MPFPENFLWGVATSAYQIEGGVAAGGRTESVWDHFSHTPGRTENGHTGDIACDHYHRWAEDVDLLAELGIPAYRFSIAWPRIFPEASGPVNQLGMDFYDRLVDRLLERNIQPIGTLYHFDLPQYLAQNGGWTARDTAFHYQDYTNVVFNHLGDRVSQWVTINEPFAESALGYLFGVFPPGHERDLQGFVTAAHHLMLGHGLAIQTHRSLSLKAPIGPVMGLAPTYPESRTPQDIAAADLWDNLENHWFLNPLTGQPYPKSIKQIFKDSGVSFDMIEPDDFTIIAQTGDFLGLNYYTHRVIRQAEGPLLNCMPVPTGVRMTEMGWEIVPDGLYDLLITLSTAHPDLPVYITENGAAFADVVNDDGHIMDHKRIQFLKQHIEVCEQAVNAGVDLRGYFVWSFIDNFEWQCGYRPRFGIVYIDYETQRRIPKASAAYYTKVIRARTIHGVD